MEIPKFTPRERQALKARAHALDAVVIIGEAGLTPAVLKEIEVALAAHELIKVRAVNDDRSERNAMFDSICSELGAGPVQRIGKLLVIYRLKPEADRQAAAPTAQRRASGKTSGAAKKVLREETKRDPVTGKLFILKRSTRKIVAGTRPPRTERIRKSGQRSTKKAFQGN